MIDPTNSCYPDDQNIEVIDELIIRFDGDWLHNGTKYFDDWIKYLQRIIKNGIRRVTLGIYIGVSKNEFVRDTFLDFFSKFFQLLVENDNVNELVLDNYYLDDLGVEILDKYLTNTKNLKFFKLGKELIIEIIFSEYSDFYTSKIKLALAKNKSIKTLEFNKECCSSLVNVMMQSLIHNETLNELKIDGGRKELHGLFSLMKENSTITSFHYTISNHGYELSLSDEPILLALYICDQIKYKFNLLEFKSNHDVSNYFFSNLLERNNKRLKLLKMSWLILRGRCKLKDDAIPKIKFFTKLPWDLQRIICDRIPVKKND